MDNITPQDVAKETCDQYTALATLKNTSKHYCLAMNDVNELRDVIQMSDSHYYVPCFATAGVIDSKVLD